MRTQVVSILFLMSFASAVMAEDSVQNNDPDYIPPSTAVFTGIDNAPNVPSSNQEGNSRQQFSNSLNKALNVKGGNQSQNGNGNGNGNAAKPLDVQPLQVEESPDKTAKDLPAGPQKIKIPDDLARAKIGPEVDAPVIEVYSQEELLTLINQNQHLHRIADIDECQLVKDIEARAKSVKLPAYQYVWGDMLISGTCTKKNIELGFEYLSKALDQGMPQAMRKVASFYLSGRYVQRDPEYAAQLIHTAAGLGDIDAQIAWVELLVKGEGSPVDYEEAYSWLHHAVIADDKSFLHAKRLLAQLADRMPENIVKRAKRYRWQ